MEKITITHKRYGTLILERAFDYQPVSTVFSENFKDKPVFIDIDTAEQVTLLVENTKGVHVSTCFPDLEKFFILHYEGPSVACVCRLASIEFSDKYNAREILDKPNYYAGPLAVA